MQQQYNEHFVERLAAESLRERRAARRWGIVFKLLLLGYVFTLTWLLFMPGAPGGASVSNNADDEGYAAIIQIAGAIAAGEPTAAAVVNHQLRAAFADDNAKGIILEINSPGGSAVESHRIYQEIRRLREKHPDKKVYAVAGDYCASGGYFIAAAADEIYADPASLLGSIGVIFSGFGFVDTLEKLGVERRVQTAGSSKSILDPFLPQGEGERVAIQGIVDDIHAVFVDAVRQGRGERLADDPAIFSGTIYSGSGSLANGLIDGFGDTAGVARDQIGVETAVYYGEEEEWWEKWIKRLDVRAALLPFDILPSGVQAVQQ